LGHPKQTGKSDESKKKFEKYTKLFKPVERMAMKENSHFIKEAY
jgi:hypothetical protein